MTRPNTLARKQARTKYEASDKGIATREEYEASDAGKAVRKEYAASPEGRATRTKWYANGGWRWIRDYAMRRECENREARIVINEAKLRGLFHG